MSLVYIVSDERSGSTMLDMMLAGHSSVVSMGEAHQLKAYALSTDNYYRSVHDLSCFCGKKFSQCEFWTAVRRQLGEDLSGLTCKPYFMREDYSRGFFARQLKRLSWLVFQVFPGLYCYDRIFRLTSGDRVGRDGVRLYEAVRSVSSATHVIDSSKSPFRLFGLWRQGGVNIKVLYLCRDYRGVVHSKSKRGISKLKSALEWRWFCKQANLFTAKLPQDCVLRVRYEDICTDTKAQMQLISEFLGLDFEEKTMVRETQDMHHLGGSPSKYAEGSQQIELDTSFQEALSTWDLLWLRMVVGSQARVWGYH